jgi:anthranilate synthase component 1
MKSKLPSFDSMTGAPLIRSVQLNSSALLALHASNPVHYPVLLESAAAGTALGRFDILFAYPQESLSLRGDGNLLERNGSASTGPFLPALDSWWRELRQAPASTHLPFRGGWFVYLGYELAAQIEPRLQLRRRHDGLIATAMRIPAAIVFEHDSGHAWIVAEAKFAGLADIIEAEVRHLGADDHEPPSVIAGTVIEDPAPQYIDAVRRALDHIERGDIYQANVSRTWRGRLQAGIKPHHVYRRLRRTNPGPFCALAVLPELAIVSSSPERLVSVTGGWISTRPIAGTRPRGIDQQADAELVSELRAHPKERAEHIMLIDLERNDLGRVCLPGTIDVDEYMTIETYAHVHHIVSNVRGRLRPDVGPGEALAAVFPGGTITGCPKVRCMEIIAELEDTARGAYTGSLGYLNLDGSMDFNILIRSIEIQGSEFSLRAGAGIVADSIPERELDEARAKARGVLRALSADVA